LFADAGLLEAKDQSTFGQYEWWPIVLTWQGHEFLDAVRNETVWSKTRELVTTNSGTVPFDVLKVIAVKVLSSMFGV
jgi:hypothetical protein